VNVEHFFKCLNCGASSRVISGKTWICTTCQQEYAVKHGIPLLVRDWQRHAAEIEQAQKVKPNWYSEEQPVEAVSPWRHHLRKRREYVERVIKAYLERSGKPAADSLLDLGCGDGNQLSYLRQYAHASFGSDYNLTRLVRAKLRFDDTTFFLADILDYPAQDAFFEIVFFNHVIEHIQDDMQALATIYRILKPHGLLILGTPNEGAWWWQLAYKLSPETLERSDHVQFYTAPVLEERLKSVGFRVQQIEHLGWGPPHWGFDMRIRKYRVVDDAFERIGRAVIPHQASSLYMICTK